MNYQLNSFVNKQEADALKELIFSRVRERSQAMTDDVQADIMNIARESFVSNNNPFSMVLKEESDSFKKSENIEAINSAPAETEQTVKKDNEIIKNPVSDENIQNIGFPQKKLSGQAISQSRLIREQMTTAQIQNNMIEARDNLANKKSFMGALSFLNSQAAVSLLRTRADKFEALA